MPAARRQRGFTLLELLLSVSLTAVVLTLLLTAVRLTERAWRRGNERLAAVAQSLAEGEAIQAQMSSAIPRHINTQYEERPLQLISFQGDSKQVRFLSNYSWEGGRNFGLWMVSYRITKEQDGKEQLMVSETGLSQEPRLVSFLMTNQPSQEQALAFGDRADQIELSYLRPSASGIPVAWVPEWKCDNQKQLPRGVRIHWQRGKEEQDLTLIIPVWEERQ
jgi:prepilin-type N-terminal cleavage/methylation domain-containing protein